MLNCSPPKCAKNTIQFELMVLFLKSIRCWEGLNPFAVERDELVAYGELLGWIRIIPVPE